MKVQLPSKFEGLFKPKRFKIFYGGRGGAKTISFSKVLLMLARQSKQKTLCLREFQNSIDDSVHSALSAEVSNLGLDNYFQILDTKILAPNGSVFKYKGFSRNVQSIKAKDYYDKFWIEEGETLTYKSLDVVIPTLRKVGSELWISFNPDNEDSAVWQEFIVPHLDQLKETGRYEDKDLLVVKTNLTDNPFAPQTLLDASASLKLSNPAKWLHIYGGELGGNYDDPVFESSWWQYYKVLPDFEYSVICADTALKDGENNDYTVFQCWAKYRGRIYLIDQFREKVKATELKRLLTEFWEAHKGTAIQPCRGVYIEDKASGTQLIQDIQGSGGIPVIAVPRNKGQSTLARSVNLSSWIKSGLLYLPEGKPWVYDYKQEFNKMSRDDSHKHDDQIDATLDAIAEMLINETPIIKEPAKPSRPIAPTKNSKIW